MKYRYITLSIILFFIASPLIAQQFHGGVMAGLVGSQVAGDSYSGFNKAGIFVGGYVKLDVGKVSALQLELAYFQKGSRENPTEKNGYQSYLLRLNYIELPVLYQYKAGRFSFFGGPSAGFLMGYHEEVNQEVISDQQYYIKPARVTLQFNLGFQFDLTPEIGFDFRTNNSVLNVFSENVTGDVFRFFDHGRYNDSLILSMFYRFN
jgi:outer membrane protein with beta-barrel domain